MPRKAEEKQKIKNNMVMLGTALGVVVLFLFATAYYSYTYTTNTIAERYKDASKKTVLQTTRNLDSMLEKLEAISMQILNDRLIKGQIVEGVQYSALNEVIFKYDQDISEIEQILIYSSDPASLQENQMKANSRSRRDGSDKGRVFLDDENRKWIGTILKADGEPVWFPSIESGFTKQGYIKDKRFFLGRKIITPMNAIKPFLVIEASTKAMDSVFSNIKLGDSGSFYLLTDTNQVVYSANPDEIGKPFRYALKMNEEFGESSFESMDGTKQIAIWGTSRFSGWKVAGIVSEKELSSGAFGILLISLFSLTLIVGICAMIIILMRRFFSMHQLLQQYSLQLETNANALKLSNEELENQSRQLEQQRDELHQLNQVKDKILANTSHELRTPLNGIIGIAESLVDGVAGAMNEKANQNLSLIIASGRRLSNLVNDILDFSKMKNSKLELKMRPVSIGPSLDLTLALLRPMLEGRPVQLINEIQTGRSDGRAVSVDPLPRVMADENRLQQIFHNLISNAMKFTEKGKIVLSAEVNGDFLQLHVYDTGIGIPEDQLDRVFVSFEQLDGSTERVYGGTGLGLAVTKQLVELHGGTLQVESKAGEWSRFTFSLRIASGQELLMTADGGSSSTIAESSELSSGRDGTAEQARSSVSYLSALSYAKNEQAAGVHADHLDVHILVVDDEPINLHVIVNQLSALNYKVTTAESGVEALARLKQGLEPDLILMDVMMPKLSGYDTTMQIRKTFPLEKLPVILLTAKNLPEDIVTGFRSGANDYLVKPFNKQELLVRIQTHLELARSNRRLSLMKERMMELLRERDIRLEEREI